MIEVATPDPDQDRDLKTTPDMKAREVEKQLEINATEAQEEAEKTPTRNNMKQVGKVVMAITKLLTIRNIQKLAIN